MAETATSTRSPDAQGAAPTTNQLRHALAQLSRFELSGWLPLINLHAQHQDRTCLAAAANLANLLRFQIELSESEGGLNDSVVASALEGILILMTLEMIGAEAEQAGEQ
jgi:hypothetical protein